MLLLVGLLASLPSQALAGDGPRDTSDSLRFRSEFGLSTDSHHVQAIENDANSSRKYGVPLSSSELAEIARRERIAASLHPLLAHLQGLGQTFGGLYLDQAAGGQVVVNLVGQSDKYHRAILELAPTDGEVQIREVQHSLAELQDAYHQMNAELPSLEALGVVIYTITLSEQRNIIDIGLGRIDPAWIAEIKGRMDPSIVAFHAAEPVVAGACSKDSCLSPERLRAGLTLTGAARVCTSGFVVHNGSNSQLLTAGHCFQGGGVGQSVYQGGEFIGNVSATLYYDYSEADVKIIDISNSRESNWLLNTYAFTTEDLNTVGTPVCRSGISSGIDCGTIVANTETVFYNSRHFINQGKTSFGSTTGDSGGVIYGGSGRAYGIFASFTSTNSWYGRLDLFSSSLNNYLCIDINCVY